MRSPEISYFPPGAPPWEAALAVVARLARHGRGHEEVFELGGAVGGRHVDLVHLLWGVGLEYEPASELLHLSSEPLHWCSVSEACRP